MSNEKTGAAATASRALQPTETNPLDFVPDKIPFDTPYGPPISLDRAQAVIYAAVAEAKKRNWKMNAAVVDSGGNLVAFQRMDGAMLASIQIAEHKARAAATFRRETKQFEDGIQLMHLNYLLAFDGIVASRGEMPPRAGFTVTHFITVADIDRLADFYEKVFGGRILSRGDSKGASRHIQIANT